MSRTLPVVQSSPGVIDPVCGMTVDPNNAAASFEYEGKTYYFCATHCLHRFQKDPESFLHKTAAPTPTTKARKYTCPMHPEIIRDGPGIARSAVWRSNHSPLRSMKKRTQNSPT
jgi:YHS domain-containing protein